MLFDRRSVLRRGAFTAAILMMPGSSVVAGSVLSDRDAMSKAVALLKGDPYGRSIKEVKANIRQGRLVSDGMTNACGAVQIPIWEFHVVVDTGNKDQFKNGVIDGYLALDARTGKIRCTNLPLLD
jgi:hypothetical protein